LLRCNPRAPISQRHQAWLAKLRKMTGS
jgi:hypothetical protein